MNLMVRWEDKKSKATLVSWTETGFISEAKISTKAAKMLEDQGVKSGDMWEVIRKLKLAGF